MLSRISPPQLVYVLLLVGTTSSIRCRCDQSVSLGLPSASCAIHNFTCTSPRGCYVRRWYSNHLNTIVQVWGCISDEHGVHNQIDYTSLFCGLLNNRTDAYQCCNTTDFCSDDLQIVLPMEMESPSPSPVASAPAHTVLVAVIIVAIAITLLGLSIPVLSFVIWRRRSLRHQVMQYSTAGSSHKHWTNDLELVEFLGSERSTDLPYRVLTDIKDIVKLNYQIEIGRFGTFYHGFYEGVEVVLKRFEETNRSAWLHESLVYSSVLQAHENVLVFFASAMVHCDSGMELWLATKYHAFGSLQDYLRQHTVNAKVMLVMVASICSGLAHLHSDGRDNQVKIAVAHCNLTSRNILIKGNLSCCIGDFRLAVFKHKNKVHWPEDAKVGTLRYMAPEMLTASDVKSFETCKQADVYTLGLVLWEVCQRTGCRGVLPEAYQVPFQGLVPPDPSLEDMCRLVVIDKAQPTILNKWSYNKLLREMTKVMRECWYYTSTARPTAVYLKKKLLKMSQELENMPDQEMMPCKDSRSDEQCDNVYVSTL